MVVAVAAPLVGAEASGDLNVDFNDFVGTEETFALATAPLVVDAASSAHLELRAIFSVGVDDVATGAVDEAATLVDETLVEFVVDDDAIVFVASRGLSSGGRNAPRFKPIDRCIYKKKKIKSKKKLIFFFLFLSTHAMSTLIPLLLLLLVLLFLIDVKCLTFVDSVDWTALRDSILPTLGLPRLPATTPPPECPGNATEHVALSCDKSGRVQSLHVSRVVLRGSLSGRIGALSELRELVLRDTLAVRGALPAEIAALSLRRFVVPANAISGTLRFLNVAQLAELDVRDNAMSGQLPPPAALVQLERIDVSGNYFTELPGSRREWAELGAQLVECRVSQFNVTPIDNSDNCWLPRDCELLPPSCTCSLSRDPERCAPFNVPTTLPPNGTATLVATTPPLSSVFTVPTTTLVPCDMRRTCRDCVAVSSRGINSSIVEAQNNCFWCYIEDVDEGFCSTIVRGVEPTCVAELKPYLVTCPVGERVVDWSVLIVTAVLLSLALASAIGVHCYIRRMRIEQRSAQVRQEITQFNHGADLVDQLVHGPPLDEDDAMEDALDERDDPSAMPFHTFGPRRNTVDVRRSRANTANLAATMSDARSDAVTRTT